MTNETFSVSGCVMPADAMVVDFNDNQLPAGWGNNASNKWSFADGKAYCTSAAELTTPKLQIAEGDFFVINATSYDDYDNNYIEITGSTDGSTWTAFETKKYISRSQIPYGSYASLVVTGIPTTVKYLKFKGYYVRIDDITGLTYAPSLSVTQGGSVVSTPDSYDFGECAADATVTYNFANAGAGTINITNVAITGDGAAAYSTNWTASTAAPFDLVITRTYDSSRTTAQAATVTVTTSEGAFVINVTGTDKAANAPELSVTLGGVAVATGDAADFGTKLKAVPAAKTYTITNAGTGTLAGTIVSSVTDHFTVSESSFSLGAAESMTFDLALVFDTNYGAKASTITIHPTNDGLNDFVINATASTIDPDTWMEDFEGGAMPEYWTTTGWTVTTGAYSGNGTYMAYAGTSSSTLTLTTPRLQATAGQQLTFFVGGGTDGTDKLTVEYSSDNANWTAMEGSPFTSGGTKTFTAPTDGYYYLKFNGKYASVDNFEGFKLAIPDHICTISASNIPASLSSSPTMKVDRSFEATVTVTESRGVAEALTAKLYMGNEVIGTATGNVAAKGTETLSIVCTPTTSGYTAMHIEVEYAGGTLTTTNVYRSVAALTYLTLDQTSSDAIPAGTYDYVTLRRPFLANWNTVCLPFTISDVEEFFGAGSYAYQFSSYNDGTVNFTKVTSLTASFPYIVFLPAAITSDIELEDISINSTDVEAFYKSSNGVYFRGTYAPIAAGYWTKYENDDTRIIYVLSNADSKLMKAGSSASSKGFRGYFDVPASEAARLSISFDDVATGIGVFTTDGELEVGNMYNMQGQKVQHAGKGIYIINGKKVVLK
jgi:hypothetical protein